MRRRTSHVCDGRGQNYYIIVLRYFTVKVRGGRVFVHPHICRGVVKKKKKTG